MRPHVYLIYNKINGHLYVGKGNKSDRWTRHITVANGGKEKYGSQYSVVHRAITKHGVDNFLCKIVQYAETDNEALELETKWIKCLKELNYTLYNCTDGGDGISGFKFSEEKRKQMSVSRRGASNPNFGKPKSDHTKNLLSIAHQGDNSITAKLDSQKVKEIKLLLLKNISQSNIAKQYNISPMTINDIKFGRTWSHINCDQPANFISINEKYSILHDKQIKYIQSSIRRNNILAKQFNVTEATIKKIKSKNY